ncbi:MAG: hypothetical protein Q4G08_02455 [Capnocytophaga sp.]|nr:hypothetical protein [Capnocytophaga sp.]
MNKTVVFTLFFAYSAITAQTTNHTIDSVVTAAFNASDISVLQAFYDAEKGTLPYQKAYLKYRMANVYGIKKQDSEGKKALEEAMFIIENQKEKNDEDWVLLALIQNNLIKFSSFVKAPFESMQVSEYLENAEKINSSNPRLYYVKALQDMYTPAMFGGGKKAEEYFKKAISLYSKVTDGNELLWGYEDTYINLIKFYVKEKRTTDAKQVFYKGVALFPRSDWFKRNKVVIEKL